MKPTGAAWSASAAIVISGSRSIIGMIGMGSSTIRSPRSPIFRPMACRPERSRRSSRRGSGAAQAIFCAIAPRCGGFSPRPRPIRSSASRPTAIKASARSRLRRPHAEDRRIGDDRRGPHRFDAFVEDVFNHYDGGYLFEHFLAPHQDAIKLHGERLGTARILTLCDDDGARIFRASWKIPAGANMADNFWRSGNLLAKLDLATGRSRGR